MVYIKPFILFIFHTFTKSWSRHQFEGKKYTNVCCLCCSDLDLLILWYMDSGFRHDLVWIDIVQLPVQCSAIFICCDIYRLLLLWSTPVTLVYLHTVAMCITMHWIFNIMFSHVSPAKLVVFDCMYEQIREWSLTKYIDRFNFCYFYAVLCIHTLYWTSFTVNRKLVFISAISSTFLYSSDGQVCSRAGVGVGWDGTEKIEVFLRYYKEHAYIVWISNFTF